MIGAAGPLFFGAVFAALFLLLRLGILAAGAGAVAPAYLAGILLGSLGDFALGLLLFFTWRAASGRRAIRWPLVSVVLLSIALKIAAYHYEAVFQRLPGAELAFYLGELRHLSSSLAANLPPLRFVLLCAVAALALRFAWHYADRRLAAVRVPRAVSALGGAALAAGIVLQVFPALVPKPMQSGSREPLSWLLRTALVTNKRPAPAANRIDFARFRDFHGLPAAAISDRRYPLCSAAPAAGAASNGRSVVILILESVGHREMIGEFDGRPLMPRLAAFAAQNLSFENVKAPGIKSVQTLPALFSGLPPNPFQFYLWQTPLPSFDGLLRQLSDAGYHNVYLHGADLNFERQRAYLQAAGFTTLIDFAAFRDATPYGWGYDDRVLFDRLLGWLETAPDDVPYLAAAATLSSHDPYVLPPDWPPVFSSQTRVLRSLVDCCRFEGEADNRTALAETYRFLDAQLGRFFDWYAAQPQPPLLVIVGDHAPYLPQESARVEHRDLRFDVPLVIGGLDVAQLARGRANARRLAGLHDVPATLAGLLGLPPPPCGLGLDLLAPADESARRRFVYAAAPESLDRLYVWSDDLELVYNRIPEGFGAERDAGQAPDPAALARAGTMLRTVLPGHDWLLREDAYFPPRSAAVVPGAPVVTAATDGMLIASHRGNREGPQPARVENSRGALERLRNSGFGWVELDVQLTRDGIPILAHDAGFDWQGRQVEFSALTLAELRGAYGFDQLLTLDEALAEYGQRFGILIEAKAQSRMDRTLLLAQRIADSLRRAPPTAGVIVDSFDEGLALSIGQLCACPIGVDLEQGRRHGARELRHYRVLGFDWVYVEQSQIDAALVRAAHAQGLKVMAYTVNDPALLDTWQAAGMRPDGVITDHELLIEAALP